MALADNQREEPALVNNETESIRIRGYVERIPTYYKNQQSLPPSDRHVESRENDICFCFLFGCACICDLYIKYTG